MKINPKDIMPVVTMAYRNCHKGKSSFKLYNSLRLTAMGNSLAITHTNGTAWIKSVVQLTDPGHFDLCVNVADLYKYLKKQKKPLELDIKGTGEGTRLVFSVGSITSGFDTVHGAEYPSLGLTFDPIGMVEFAPGVHSHYNGVALSVSTDYTRSHLQQILIEFSDLSAKFVTTDGSRLTCIDNIPLISNTFKPGSCKYSERFTIPQEIIKIVGKLNKSDTFRIGYDNGNCYFLAFLNNVAMVWPDPESVDRFPPYEKVIPSTSDFDIKVNPVEFIKVLTEAKQVRQPKESKLSTYAVILQFEGLQDRFSVMAENGNEEYRNFVSCRYFGHGKFLKIGGNINYLIDALTIYKDLDSVSLRLGNEYDPMYFYDYSGKMELTVLVMPLRL